MNTATADTESTKIRAMQIRIVWSEGGEDVAPFTSFAAFDLWARQIAASADHYCAKTQYEITWADGLQYTGRFDFRIQDALEGLGTYLCDFAGIYAGRVVPSHFQGREVELARMLDASEPGRAFYERLLDGYQIGDIDDRSTPANDNAIEAATCGLAVQTAPRARGDEPLPGCNHVHGRPGRETAALIRAELKSRSKTSTGPLAGVVCRVTYSRGIDVKIVTVPDHGSPVLNPRYIEADDASARTYGIAPLSKRGKAILSAVEAVVASYNWTRSITRTSFYSDVNFSSELQAAASVEIRRAIALMAQA